MKPISMPILHVEDESVDHHNNNTGGRRLRHRNRVTPEIYCSNLKSSKSQLNDFAAAASPDSGISAEDTDCSSYLSFNLPTPRSTKPVPTFNQEESYIDHAFESRRSPDFINHSPLEELTNRFKSHFNLKRSSKKLFESDSYSNTLKFVDLNRVLPYIVLTVVLASAVFTVFVMKSSIDRHYNNNGNGNGKLAGNGKYESIHFGAEKWKENAENEGRVLAENIQDEKGLLLGGKKASIQYGHNLQNKENKEKRDEEDPFRFLKNV